MRGLLLAVVAWGCAQPQLSGTGPLTGQVVGMDGAPIPGARLTLTAPDSESLDLVADDEGWFSSGEPMSMAWVRAWAPGYHPRTRAASPDSPLLVRLDQDHGDTVRMVFGGDVMFGRRFISEGRVRLPHAAHDVEQALRGVSPLWQDAHLVSVNLETPIWHGSPHPNKEHVLLSPPGTAEGLAAAGVGFVNLANNHIYDHQEGGLAGTTALLDRAGLSWQGAGADSDEAWEPLVTEVRGISVAMVGCTTITGEEHSVSYVASHEGGGAAHCDPDTIGHRVAASAEQADLVVFQVHGGYQYSSEESAGVGAAAQAALDAGAHLVVGHHPHVLHGLDLSSGRLIATSLGNLAFDQELWETFATGLLFVHADGDGTVQRAWLEPLIMDRYMPAASRGWWQRRVARRVMALASSNMALDDGALEVDLAGRGETEAITVALEGPEEAWGDPVDLRDGWFREATGAGSWRLGRDLLGVGDFEEIHVLSDGVAAPLWSLDSVDEGVSVEAAREGSRGLWLTRAFTSREPVWTGPTHRLPLDGSGAVTVAGHVRTEGSADVVLSWYEAMEGESSWQVAARLPASGTWESFQVTEEPPEGAVAVGLFLRLHPPERGKAEAHFDGIRVVQWDEGAMADPGHDVIQVRGQVVVTLERRGLPVTAR